jgi:hypothetical protein
MARRKSNARTVIRGGKAIYEYIKPGRPPRFADPQAMWDRAVDYFRWAEENPIQEEKHYPMQGEVIEKSIDKLRAFTLNGLCLFIGLDTETFRRYGTGENGKGAYKEVVALIKQVVNEQQFTGAAADVLNPNIIARALGLYEKTVNENLNYSVQMSKDEIKAVAQDLEKEF